MDSSYEDKGELKGKGDVEIKGKGKGDVESKGKGNDGGVDDYVRCSCEAMRKMFAQQAWATLPFVRNLLKCARGFPCQGFIFKGPLAVSIIVRRLN